MFNWETGYPRQPFAGTWAIVLCQTQDELVRILTWYTGVTSLGSCVPACDVARYSMYASLLTQALLGHAYLLHSSTF